MAYSLSLTRVGVVPLVSEFVLALAALLSSWSKVDTFTVNANGYSLRSLDGVFVASPSISILELVCLNSPATG